MENKNRFDITEWRRTYLNEGLFSKAPVRTTPEKFKQIMTSPVNFNADKVADTLTLDQVKKLCDELKKNLDFIEQNPGEAPEILSNFKMDFVPNVAKYLKNKSKDSYNF
jgi:hypothetical protein